MLPVQKPEMAENIAISRLLETASAMFSGEKYFELSLILASLRGLAILHQTHHWQTSGPLFYSDHLLFERLYTETAADIDPLAEKIVSLGKPALVGFSKHIIEMSSFLKTLKNHSTSDDFSRKSLEAEIFFVELVEAVIKRFELQGILTRGLENLLGEIAGKHENLIYLLKQRVSE